VRAATPVVAGSGHIWVTRRNVHVDRIASAWLIRHFIDPQAAFKFVPAKGYRPQPGELRFDMFEGEFTHEVTAVPSRSCCNGMVSTNRD
jgi:hypothetical protein